MWINIKKAGERYGVSRQRLNQIIKGQTQKKGDKEYFIKPKLKENVHWRYFKGKQFGNISQVYEINQDECDMFFEVE
jgi:hypothetical protein